MKKFFIQILIFLFMVCLPLTTLAQISGGAIRRPVKKPTQNATVPVKPSNPRPSGSTSSSNRGAVLSQLESDMVYIEGGAFTMGATSEQGSDADSNERPAHSVTLSSFRICKHDVTQAEWQAVMGSNPSCFKGASRPVENVSWDDCKIFISKLNSITGKNFRLPTEAEWEYAARVGQKSQRYKYSGSNTLKDVAWYIGNSGNETHDVMTKSPNELGLYDMSGNVSEWCSDRFGEDYYSSSLLSNPKGPSTGSFRVTRGNCVYDFTQECRVSHRSYSGYDYKASGLGLRLAL